jgi:tRNA (guanine-N7-)-methyltransferase
MSRLRKTGRIWRRAETDSGDGRIVASGDYFSIEPDSLFPRQAPLEVEIGGGRADFIISRATAMPERNFLAIELSLPLVRLLATRAAHAELRNLKIVRADAVPIVNLFLPRGSVSAYHVYFPDPWPKARHAKRRLFTPFFVTNLRRTMNIDALLYVATDALDYAKSIFSMAKACGFQPTDEPIPSFETTGFGLKFMTEGRTIYAQAFRQQIGSYL